MDVPLSKLGIQKTGTIKNLLGGAGFKRKITSMGIRIGKNIKIMSLQPFMGPIVIEVDNMRIAIGRGMANKIIVEVK